MEYSFSEEKAAILKLIPKGRTSHQNMIIAFEKIQAVMKKRKKCCLDDLAAYWYKTKCKDFEKIDTFFKKVHKIIRSKATESTHFKDNLIKIAVNNFLQNSGIYHGSAMYGRAYNKTLDFYDPNKKQQKRKGIFNWSGFWSLIHTKNGKVIGCYLWETMDVELFYEALR
ncbi:MAG: hypothetical protein ACRBFS_21655 [Aureispira sp.]